MLATVLAVALASSHGHRPTPSSRGSTRRTPTSDSSGARRNEDRSPTPSSARSSRPMRCSTAGRTPAVLRSMAAGGSPGGRRASAPVSPHRRPAARDRLPRGEAEQLRVRARHEPRNLLRRGRGRSRSSGHPEHRRARASPRRRRERRRSARFARRAAPHRGPLDRGVFRRHRHAGRGWRTGRAPARRAGALGRRPRARAGGPRRGERVSPRRRRGPPRGRRDGRGRPSSTPMAIALRAPGTRSAGAWPSSSSATAAGPQSSPRSGTRAFSSRSTRKLRAC